MDKESLNPVFLKQADYRNLTPDELLPGVPAVTVLDYWRWAHSDVLENVQRGIFAEFLVAAALNITNQRRVGWASFDLDYDGYKLEIKSSAYVQAWKQVVLSSPQFGIGARLVLEDDGVTYTSDARRVADCFVFCLFKDKVPLTANVLDADRWLFYVVPISKLIAACGSAKTLSLKRLETFSHPVSFSELRDQIDIVRSAAEDASLATPAEARAPSDDNQISGWDEAPAPSDDVHGKTVAARKRVYVVGARVSRVYPVIVEAADYREAHLLARADPTIASFGTQISAFALSKRKLDEALKAGAIDLRGGQP